MKEITKKIVGVAMAEQAPKEVKLQEVSESMQLPDELSATRYRLKTPLSTSALYIVISDIVLNPGTPFERKQPVEVFINSKDTRAYQWVVALTRMLSAVLRKGGDVAFIVEELKSIHDPNGGYLGRGGIWVPSLVAEIGGIIEKHMIKCGIINKELSPEQKQFVEAKVEEMKSAGIDVSRGEQCPNCNEFSYVRMEGCYTCTSCGHSKCG